MAENVPAPMNAAAPRLAVQSGDAVEMLWKLVRFYDAIDRDHAPGEAKLLDAAAAVVAGAQSPAAAQAASKQLSDFAELKLLIDEYDPTNSDWNFRRGVLLDILVRLWPQASSVSSASRGTEA